MAFYALTPRSFPFEFAHPDDPAISWRHTCVKMGFFDGDPEDEPTDAVDRIAHQAKLKSAMIKAQSKYWMDLNTEDLVLEGVEELKFFKVSIIPDEVRRRRQIRARSERSKRGDKGFDTLNFDLNTWAYKAYVEPPPGIAVVDSMRSELGRVALALSMTSISTEPADDVGK